MLKILLTILFITLPITTETDVASLMKNANELYRNGAYEQSLKEYNIIIDQGYEGVSLFYNTGNAYYRVGKLGWSILYYEKALKLDPNDEDVKHNLSLAKLGTKDRVETLPSFIVFEIWESLLAALSITGWTILLYVIFIFLLVALALYFFANSSSLQRISFFSGLAFLITISILIVLLSVKINKEFNLKEGIIVNPEVTVKLSPDNTAKDGFIVHEGLKVKIEDYVDNWVKIRLEDGKVGWLPKSSLGVI